VTNANASPALRGVLLALAVLTALVGVLSLLSSGWIFVMWPAPADPVVGLQFGIFIKAIGALAIGMAWIVYAASRDPIRYGAVTDALIVMLAILAAVDVYAALEPRLVALFPPGIFWLGAAVRAGIAVILFLLRPKTQRP